MSIFILFQFAQLIVPYLVSVGGYPAAGPAGKNAPVGRFQSAGESPMVHQKKAATNVAVFLLHHSLRNGLAFRASARVRLAGTGR